MPAWDLISFQDETDRTLNNWVRTQAVSDLLQAFCGDVLSLMGWLIDFYLYLFILFAFSIHKTEFPEVEMHTAYPYAVHLPQIT